MNNQSNLIKYRILAPIYDLMMGNRLFARVRKRTFALLNLEPGQRILLIGVGTGEDLAFFKTDADVYGIDLSEDMLKRARQKVGSRNISLLRMNAEAMPFQDADFDVIIMNLILSVVEDPVRAAGEAVRVLKPGGKILVFDKFIQGESSPSWLRKLLMMPAPIVLVIETERLHNPHKGPKGELLFPVLFHPLCSRFHPVWASAS